MFDTTDVEVDRKGIRIGEEMVWVLRIRKPGVIP